MLVPQGDAAHASMGTMDLGAIQRDRDWRQSQRNQLTTDVNDLNNKFANITAVNDEQAQLLAERKAFYDQQRQEILNGKGFITDKYNKIKLLGNQAANDPVLSNVKQWTEAYNANQLAINNIKNQDEDVAIALQKDLETRSKNPFITQINPEVDPTTGTYRQGAVGTNRYNQYLPTTLTEIPDLGLDAQKFLKDAGTQELISAGLRPLGKGQYLAINTNKILTEADALKQAADYIAQSNKYQDYFKLKEQGRQLRGLSWTEAEKRKYIEDAVRGSALHARTNDYDVQNIDLTSNYGSSGSGGGGGDGNVVINPDVATSTTTMSTLTNKGKGNTSIEDYYADIKNQENVLDNTKTQYRNYLAGRSNLTDSQAAGLKASIETMTNKLSVLKQDKVNWERTQKQNNGTVAPALKLRETYVKTGVLNSKTGNQNVYAGATVFGVPYNVWYKKQQEKGALHDIPGNSSSEFFDLAEKVKKGKAKSWEKEIFNAQRKGLENVLGEKVSDDIFYALTAKGGAIPKEIRNNPAKYKKFKELERKLDYSGFNPNATTEMGEVLKNVMYYNVTKPITQGYDYHLKQKGEAPATSSTMNYVHVPLSADKELKVVRQNIIHGFSNRIDGFGVQYKNGMPVDPETVAKITPVDIVSIGTASVGETVPMVIKGKIPKGTNGSKTDQYGEYIIFVNPKTHPAIAEHVKDYFIRGNFTDKVNAGVSEMFAAFNGPSASREVLATWKETNPVDVKGKTYFPITNVSLDSKASLGKYVTEIRKVPITRSGQSNYVVSQTAESNPLISLYTQYSKKFPKKIDQLYEVVSKLPQAQQLEYLDANPKVRLLLQAKAMYQTAKANNFKAVMDSDDALTHYIDEMKKVYEQINYMD
jgi:hypothetical protein